MQNVEFRIQNLEISVKYSAIAFGLIGELRSEEGEFDVALHYLEKTLELCEELGYQKGVAKAVNNLGDIAAHRKNYDDAIDYYQLAIDISRKILDMRSS